MVQRNLMKCPICKTPVPDAAAARPATYPFCSDRCKLIDLGRWLDGKYQIPVHEDADDPTPPAASQPGADDDDGSPHRPALRPGRN